MDVYLNGLGREVQECVSDALKAWREAHAPSLSTEQLLTEAVTSVTCEVTMWRGGRATAFTTIRGRRQYDDETQVYRLARLGANGWCRRGSSLPSG